MRALSYGSFLLVILLGASCKKGGGGGNSDIDLRKGLMVYLPFTGNTIDSSGNFNSVQALGSTGFTADQHGRANSAYDASQGRLLITDNGSINFDTALTVCFNFKLNTANSLQCFLGYVDNVTGFGASYSIGLTVPTSNNFQFAVQDGTGSCGTFADPAKSNNEVTNFLPNSGTWYNMVCIYHKGTNSVYINGVLSGTQTSSGTSALFCSSSKMIVGGWWNTGPEPMDGSIDEVRLYNRVLNADEIAQLYKNFQ